MTDTPGGEGTANDPTVDVVEGSGLTEADIQAGHEAALATHRAEYAGGLAAVRAKVNRAREQLDAAEQAVARIEAEWAALEPGLVAAVEA